MNLTADQRIRVIKDALNEFKKLTEPVQDVPMVHFDTPIYTLGEAIAHCEESLGVNWRDYNQVAISDELVCTFGQVAHNLKPEDLNKAMRWLHFLNQDLLLLRERG